MSPPTRDLVSTGRDLDPIPYFLTYAITEELSDIKNMSLSTVLS